MVETKQGKQNNIKWRGFCARGFLTVLRPTSFLFLWYTVLHTFHSTQSFPVDHRMTPTLTALRRCITSVTLKKLLIADLQNLCLHFSSITPFPDSSATKQLSQTGSSRMGGRSFSVVWRRTYNCKRFSLNYNFQVIHQVFLSLVLNVLRNLSKPRWQRERHQIKG